MKTRRYFTVLSAVGAIAAFLAATVIGGTGSSSAQSADIEISYAPGAISLQAGESGTVEIRADNLPVGQADTMQLLMGFDSQAIEITAGRCVGPYGGGFSTGTVEIFGPTDRGMACSGAGFPTADSGIVAEIDITHLTTGDTTISFAFSSPFGVAFLDGGTPHTTLAKNELLVTDDDISPGFRFLPDVISMGNGESVTVDITSGLIDPGSADFVQVSIVHDDSVVAIDSVACKGLYEGATLVGPARVENDTATSFSCNLAGAPLDELGAVAEVTFTRVGPGDPTISFVPTGPFRTAFISAGVEVSQGNLGTLQVETAAFPCAIEAYDTDLDSLIDRDEAIQAVTDFLLQRVGVFLQPLVRTEAIEIVTAFLLGTAAECSP